MVRLIPENNTLREYLAQELVNQNNSMIMSGRTGEYHDREMTLDDACQFIFHTYTGSNVELTGRPRQGIQLSPKGYRWMKAYYESYKVESSFHLINNHLLYFDRYFEWPYYIITKRPRKWNRKPRFGSPQRENVVRTILCCFGGPDAIELKLLGGDFTQWVKNKKQHEEE